MIELSVNGEHKTLSEVMSLEQALLLWDFVGDGMVIAVNQVFVPRAAWAGTLLGQDDQVEVLQAVVGG